MSSNTSTATATAVVAHAAGDLRVESIEVPAPAAHEARIAIAYGGICGSDLHYWSHGAAGESILKAPMILGHEIVGTVIDGAADGTGPAAGTGRGAPGHPGRRGRALPRGPAEPVPGLHLPGLGGAFPAHRGCVRRIVNLPSRMLRSLPDGLSLRDAALAEPAAVAWHAVSRAGDVAGKRVLVIGAGPIGALAVAVLKRAGAAEIIAVDMFDKPLEIATSAGAIATLKATDAEAIAAVEADVVIEASGNHRGLASAVRGSVRGGRIVMVGLLPSGEQPALISLAITRELELVGSFRFNDEIDEVIAALADGTLDVSAIVTHEFDVNDALGAFEAARNSAESGKVLLKF